MIERYRRWCLKQASTAQCSPVFGVLGILVCVGAICYVYREVILKTIETALIAAIGVAAVVAVGAITLNTLRWYRKNRAVALASAPAVAEADTWTAPTDTVPVTDASEALTEEADWLASGVELAFGPDGSLKAKGGD
jgi:hypothetical protein